MRYKLLLILNLILFLIPGCIIQFFPDTEEEKTLLVVEGMITDQYQTCRIKVSYSIAIGKMLIPKPVRGCKVSITDEEGIVYNLKEQYAGVYITDSTIFRGHANGTYKLFIRTSSNTYETDNIEMKSVPPIDSLYYEKVFIGLNEFGYPEEGCQIYLDSYDPLKECLYYRWDYMETWEFQLPYNVPNRICWKYRSSDKIFIRNTSVYNQARITKFPVQYISNLSDRLKVKYSILVNQYSLNAEEFIFWEKVKNVSENVGGLYDVTPMAIPSNIRCIEEPDQPVLGYFSVSSVARKRIFIKDTFLGSPNYYSICPGDTIYGNGPIPGLGVYVWVIVDHSTDSPPWRVLTEYQNCADCTLDGTNLKPSFWVD